MLVMLEEALKATGMEDLYVPEEGRIYESLTFLKWHQRYLESSHQASDVSTTKH